MLASKIFNILTPSLTTLRNSHVKFKVAFKKILKYTALLRSELLCVKIQNAAP